MCQGPPVHSELITHFLMNLSFLFVLKQCFHSSNGDIDIISFLYYDLKWGKSLKRLLYDFQVNLECTK